MVPKSAQTNSAKHARITTPIGSPTPLTQGPASIIQPRRRRARADRRHLSETASVCATVQLGNLQFPPTMMVVFKTAVSVKRGARPTV